MKAALTVLAVLAIFGALAALNLWDLHRLKYPTRKRGKR